MSRDEKLLVILDKLDQHQDEVRRSMMFLVAQHKARLVEEAKEALGRERLASGRRRRSYDKDASAPDEQEIQDLLRRLRAPVRPGASPRDYEYKPGDLDAAARIVGMGDAANDNNGTGPHPEMPSREAMIRATLDEELRNLVRRATAEMKNYDVHAQRTKNHYRQALLRSATSDWSHALSADAALPAAGGGPVAGGGGPDAAAAARKGGILVNRNAEIFVNTQALARMATEESGSPTQAGRGSGDGMKDLRRW